MQESQKGAGSVFCKINSTDKNDLKFLKEKRKAKVNGYYDDYDTWGDKKSEREFFEKLLLGGTSKLASLGISVLVASVL